MAGNNSIQILRGDNVKSTAANEILLDGQPLYDRTTGYLYVGEGNTVANTQAVNAHYANSAGSASSSSYATYSGRVSSNLVINNGTSSVNYIGNVSRTIYAPTSLGTSGQVWGMRSSGRAGWIDQTEIPGTIEHANTANVAYEVSGSNVAGTVANANFAATAGKVTHSFKLNVNGTTYTYNGSNVDIDILDDNPVVTLSKTTEPGAIVYTNSTGRINWLSHPGVSGRVLTSGSSGSISWGSAPDEKYWFFAQDTERGLFFMYSTGTSNPGTPFLNLIFYLDDNGYDSSNPLPAIGFDSDNKFVRGIYAPNRQALIILHTDGTIYSRDITSGLAIQAV